MSDYLGLTDGEWSALGRLLELLEQRRSTTVCFEATQWLERRLGWRQVSGWYVGGGRRVGHYWCLRRDGTLIDPTHDQFDPDGDPVRVLPPGDRGHADYRRDDRAG